MARNKLTALGDLSLRRPVCKLAHPVSPNHDILQENQFFHRVYMLEEPYLEPDTALVNTLLSDDIPNTTCPISDSERFLCEELNVDALDNMKLYLHMAGPGANEIRPLHSQKIVGRDIVIAELAELHLVWERQVIFVKPIPRCLLHYEYFKEHVRPNPRIHQLALAFLSTYLRLIRYESDFQIAHTLGLVPQSTAWEDWLRFSKQLQSALVDPSTQKRMIFTGRYARGELSLFGLNVIARVFMGRIGGGFIALDIDANPRDHVTAFLSIAFLAFGYAGIGLGAFQVAMATPDSKLGQVGYWFAVVILILLALLSFCVPIWMGGMMALRSMSGTKRELEHRALLDREGGFDKGLEP